MLSKIPFLAREAHPAIYGRLAEYAVAEFQAFSRGSENRTWQSWIDCNCSRFHENVVGFRQCRRKNQRAESWNASGGAAFPHGNIVVKKVNQQLPFLQAITFSHRHVFTAEISHRKMAQPKIGLILCSTRDPRVGPSIASWIAGMLTPDVTNGTTIKVLDLEAYQLPVSLTGPVVPAHQPVPLPPDPYPSAEVNIWSAEINSCAGFIFLTPQYNWSYPAAIKIAIDHLFHEWVGKPALIVSYGGRGGGKANDALRQVLQGLRCNPWEGRVELAIGGGKGIECAVKGILDEVVRETWVSAGKEEEIVERVRELVKLVAPVPESGEE